MVTANIRLCRDEDFSQIVDIATDHLGQVRSEAEGVISWASKDKSAQIFVAEADIKVVGFLMLQWTGLGWNRIAEIGWIAVHPEYRRKGLGSGLTKRMEDYAKEKGIRKVYVEPSVRNDIAIRFFVKNGYDFESGRKDWYKDGENSAILGKHLQRGRPDTRLKGLSNIILRRFEERDEDGIRSIYPEFFEDNPQLRSEEGFIVAEMDGQIVGFYVITTHSTYPWWDRNVKSWCEIIELHVYNKFYRRGIGTQLVQNALDYARSKGVENIYVMTGEDNVKARGLYEKCGFEEFERKIRYKQTIQRG